MFGLLRWLSGKESACQEEDAVQLLGWISIPGSISSTLEKKMATHSSMLSWKIPRAEEPGGLQSMGVAKESDTTEHTNNPCLQVYVFLNIIHNGTVVYYVYFSLGIFCYTGS